MLDALIMIARRCIVTVLLEARLYRTEDVSGEHWTGEPAREHDQASGEVFLAEEQLHPSLDEIFHQIDTVHRRTLEFERLHLHPAHARHGAR